MKIRSFIAILFFNTVLSYAQVIPDWASNYGSPQNKNESKAICVDNEGNIIVTGKSYTDSTNYDYLTIKYDKDGQELWVKRYNSGNNGVDFPTSIVVDDSNNVFVTGYCKNIDQVSDLVTIKYSQIGIEKWVKKYSGPGNEDYSAIIISDNSGKIYTACTTNDKSGANIAVNKFDTNGNILFSKLFLYDQTNQNEFISLFSSDKKGNLYLSCSSLFDKTLIIKLDSTGNQIKQFLLPLNRGFTTLDEMGSILLISGEPDGSIKMLKSDTSGLVIWSSDIWPSTDLGSASSVIGSDCISDGSGNFYGGGDAYNRTSQSSGLYFSFLVKYNASGELLWARRHQPKPSSYFTYKLLKDPIGNIISFGQGDNGFNIIKYDSLGNEKWVGNYKDIKYSQGEDIAIDNLGNIFITGYSYDGYNDDSKSIFTTIKISYGNSTKVVSDVTSNPQNIILDQNYPNPFNPTTKIDFNIIKQSNVEVDIYDLLGKKIDVVLNERKSPGFYSIIWNGSNFSSGIYFIILKTENGIQTKKMNLIK